MSASLFSVLQWLDAAGTPLAGGSVYTYAAGTTTPQAAYTDASGTTPATNPIVLDAAGRALIWLGALSYKLLVRDAGGVQQYLIDNVSAVSLAQLTGNNALASLAVSGNTTVGGNLSVSGVSSASSLVATGSATVAGTLTAQQLVCNSNAGVTGNLSVTGTTNLAGATTAGAVTAGAVTVSSLTVGATALADFVAALIPAISGANIAGSTIITSITAQSGWIQFFFGGLTGQRTMLAWGSGIVANGASITLPSGVPSANFVGHVSLATVNSTSGNQLNNIAVSLSGLVCNATGSDNSSHVYSATCSWMGFCWQTGV